MDIYFFPLGLNTPDRRGPMEFFHGCVRWCLGQVTKLHFQAFAGHMVLTCQIVCVTAVNNNFISSS